MRLKPCSQVAAGTLLVGSTVHAIPHSNHSLFSRAIPLPNGLQACSWPPVAGASYMMVSAARANTVQCISSQMGNRSGGKQSGPGTFAVILNCDVADSTQQISFTQVGNLQYIVNFRAPGTCAAGANQFVGDGSPVEQTAQCTKDTTNAVWRINNVDDGAAQLINTQSTPNKCLGIGNVEARGTGNPGDPVAFFSCGGSLASTKSQFFALASRNCGNPQTQQQQPAAPKQADPPAPVPVPVPAPVPAPQQPQSPAATPVAVPRPTFPSPPPQQPASPVVVALTTPVIAASPVFRPLPTFVIPTPTPSPISMNPTPGPVISPTADGAPPRTPALVAAAINIQSDPVAVLNMVPITHMMALVLLLAPIAVVSCVFAIIAMVRKVKHIRYLRKKIQLAES